MTELRDARLHKALEEAPDAQLRPHRRTREAVRAAAHAAVQPAWRRWWTRAAAHPAPWTAALASVALATLVTVTWHGREPPSARTDAPVAAPQAPVPAAAPAPPVAPAPQVTPAPQVAQAPAARPRPAPATAPGTVQDRSASAAPDALAKAAPARGEARDRAAAAPPAPPAPYAETSPVPVPPAPAAPAAAPAPAPLPAPAPALAERPPALERQAAPAAPAAALRAAPTALPWTQVRIEAGGRSVVVPRTQAGRLPALVTSMLASTSDEAEAGTQAVLKLELAQGDEALGVLEQVGDDWRWTPLHAPGPARLLRADAEVAQALRAEARRLLRR